MSQEEQNLEDLQTEGNEHGIKKGQQQQLNGHSDSPPDESRSMAIKLWWRWLTTVATLSSAWKAELTGRSWYTLVMPRCQTHCLSDYDGYGYGYPNRENRILESKAT